MAQLKPFPSDHRELQELVAKAAELLPAQGPLHLFVHHNTLHAFEDLPFEQAVIKAAGLFGTKPYQSERAFAKHITSGRIQPVDLRAVLAAECEEPQARVVPNGPTRENFVFLRLQNLFEIPRGSALSWKLTEEGALRRLDQRVSPQARRWFLKDAEHLQHPRDDGGRDQEQLALEYVWWRLSSDAPLRQREVTGPRRRDQILAALGIDTDAWVHPFLIRLSAAFVDQGIAYWRMPGWQSGLLAVFRQLYSLPVSPPNRWLRGLADELLRQQREGWSAEDTVVRMLEKLGISRNAWFEYIRATLLSLRGWAGMIRQFERWPDRAPVEARPGILMDYLAIQLSLDVQAAHHALQKAQSAALDWNALEALIPRPHPEADLELAYEAFLMAQLAGVGPRVLCGAEQSKRWLREVANLGSHERLRLLHLAYERRHRVIVLDGLMAHSHKAHGQLPTPDFQAVFCIDDREESLRRHLEETYPRVESFGYAGFFGVAMAYRGHQDIRSRPLCPVNIVPAHLIAEEIAGAHQSHSGLNEWRANGQVRHAMDVGSKTLIRGGVISALFGLWEIVPLIGRCLFPRATERMVRRLAGRSHRASARTRLRIERDPASQVQAPNGLIVGFTVEEMASIVESALRTMGLDRDFCSLVLTVGHGSSSLNNPHEAAHDCGATGGGRGGPNARAIAAMANHTGVRALLRDRGLVIPETTWFIGAYHNTCDESMHYYDEDLVPAALHEAFTLLKDVMSQACMRNAQERCRRFECASLQISPHNALAHVEKHSFDLGQPRPEYGHATNAVCIVGRRARTRGLFLDRRAFLVSYDPTKDLKGDVLEALLLSVAPVGAGINLEYYFSFVDPTGYGCGTKLPHNITGLLGVMDGHASDLRTGLPWQMVEIHEPVRMLTIVEAEPSRLERIMEQRPAFKRLVHNRWIQLVAWSPTTNGMAVFDRGQFVSYVPEHADIPVFESSAQAYIGHREHLGCASIRSQ